MDIIDITPGPERPKNTLLQQVMAAAYYHLTGEVRQYEYPSSIDQGYKQLLDDISNELAPSNNTIIQKILDNLAEERAKKVIPEYPEKTEEEKLLSKFVVLQNLDLDSLLDLLKSYLNTLHKKSKKVSYVT